MFRMILTCAAKRDRQVLFGSSPEERGRQHAERTRAQHVYWHVCSNKRLEKRNGRLDDQERGSAVNLLLDLGGVVYSRRRLLFPL